MLVVSMETWPNHARIVLISTPERRRWVAVVWRLFRPRNSRHSYSTLLRATGADIKVMQKLLRHASARVTLDTYTQAITDQKRNAQSAVVKLLVAPGGSAN